MIDPTSREFRVDRSVAAAADELALYAELHLWQAIQRAWQTREASEEWQATQLGYDAGRATRSTSVPREPGHQPKIESRMVFGDAGIFDYKATLYRAACYGCGWHSLQGGGVADDERAAVEQAHDHAFPGWRDVPIITPARELTSTRAEKLDVMRVIDRLYPSGWIDRRGPIRVYRDVGMDRHVPGLAPTGGYEMGVASTRVIVEAEPVRTQMDLLEVS